MTGFAACSITALAALLGGIGCADRHHANPLDPRSSNATAAAGPLEVIAGDRQVTLRWDYSRFDDLEAVELYRRIAPEAFTRHPASPLGVVEPAFVDSPLVNEITYEYQLALSVREEGERFVGSGRPADLGQGFRRATPGEEFTWVGDPGSGLVWRISPDGRGALFAQGRFPFIEAVDVDHRDGSCWVSAGEAGIFRISPAGAVQPLSTPLDRAGQVAIDSAAGVGWVIDSSTRDVFWFSLDVGEEGELALHGVDARFGDPAALAPAAGVCWIVDREEGRVLRYRRQDKSRAEWAGLENPGVIAAADGATAWLLAAGGRRLVRLGGEGAVTDIPMPFPQAVAIEVDRLTGSGWVLAGADLAVFSAAATLESSWRLVAGAVSMDLDPLHQRVWIASDEALWKIDMTGEILSRLDGFAAARHLAVHPRDTERI